MGRIATATIVRRAAVLDALAVLTFLYREPGHEVVADLIGAAWRPTRLSAEGVSFHRSDAVHLIARPGRAARDHSPR